MSKPDKLFTAKQYERMRLEMGLPVAKDGLEDLKDADGNTLIQVVEELPATPVDGVIYLVREV